MLIGPFSLLTALLQYCAALGLLVWEGARTLWWGLAAAGRMVSTAARVAPSVRDSARQVGNQVGCQALTELAGKYREFNKVDGVSTQTTVVEGGQC